MVVTKSVKDTKLTGCGMWSTATSETKYFTIGGCFFRHQVKHLMKRALCSIGTRTCYLLQRNIGARGSVTVAKSRPQISIVSTSLLTETYFSHKRKLSSGRRIRDSDDNDLFQRTSHFLNSAHGLRNTADSQVWQEAEAILAKWIDRSASPTVQTKVSSMQRVEQCLSILDQLASFLPQTSVPRFGSVFDTDLLNRILLLWRDGVKDASGSKPKDARRSLQKFSPSRMAEKVDKYRFASLIQPDSKTFNILLDGAASFPYRDGVVFADALLEKLIHLAHDEEANLTPFVDIVSVGTVIKAWVRHGNPTKADSWLQRLRSWSESEADFSNTYLTELRPHNIIYSTVMNGWATQGDYNRTEEILRSQIQDYHLGNLSAQPDTMTFNIVLNSFAKSNDSAASTKAESIISEMRTNASSFGWNTAPDKYSWASLVECHAKKNPDRAEALLHEISETELLLTVPYNKVLQSYAQSGRAKDANRLLEFMEASEGIDPDVTSYNIVLSAYSKSKASYAPLEAETLLARMRERGIYPNTISYGSVLQCWAKSSEKMASDRAEDLLHEMQQDPRTQPNIICYNILFNIWGTRARRFRDTSAVNKVVRMLDELLKPTTDLSPTESTFRAVLHAIAGSTVKNKGKRVSALVKIMERHGFKPTKSEEKVIKRLMKAETNDKR